MMLVVSYTRRPGARFLQVVGSAPGAAEFAHQPARQGIGKVRVRTAFRRMTKGATILSLVTGANTDNRYRHAVIGAQARRPQRIISSGVDAP